ncbi:hypothetical protein SDC9_79012 [bioreactor metagenome]|uniref:HTH cro/C1-type domain-containing protein n=1 Tax=bioreactor metagenome TaxID=1076179 RepID=A0A644YV11_9ZZZZ
MDKLRKKIKARREELGLTQYELAKKLGYKSKSTIAKIEAGKNELNQSKLTAFADALETTPSELMGWKEIKSYYSDEIEKAINMHIYSFVIYLKACCIKLSFQCEKLTDKYYELISCELADDISQRIDFEFYDKILSECFINIDKIGENIPFKDIENIVRNNLKSEIKELVELEFIASLENIYDNINGTNIRNEYLVDNSVSSSICNIITNERESSILDDLTDDINDTMYDELFHDVFKEIIINFVKQLNVRGKEKALDYIKYLKTNDENTEELINKDLLVQLKENDLVRKELNKGLNSKGR